MKRGDHDGYKILTLYNPIFMCLLFFYVYNTCIYTDYHWLNLVLFLQIMYKVFILQCQKVQITKKVSAAFSENSRNKLHSNNFEGCPLSRLHLYCYLK
jgi:hypothetical protein